jgi:hypothetical protein
MSLNTEVQSKLDLVDTLIFLVLCQPSLSFSINTINCPRSRPIAANVCVSAVVGIGGLSNGAKRNAKADQLRPVPRHNVNKENESNEDTEPRHCRNILLAAGHLSQLSFLTP